MLTMQASEFEIFQTSKFYLKIELNADLTLIRKLVDKQINKAFMQTLNSKLKGFTLLNLFLKFFNL